VPESAEEYCTPDRAVVRRAWSLFIAKNKISDDEVVANGSKLMGVASMMMPCGGGFEVNLTPLAPEEIAQFRSFAPSGVFVAWTQCLSSEAPAKSLAYLEASDRAAFVSYVRTKQIGGHDDAAFVDLISTDGCGKHFVESVKAQEFYEDLNWFVRIAPRSAEITDWHGGVR
jgi:hypothetical protein